MGIMAYSLLWVTQDLYHQPYQDSFEGSDQGFSFRALCRWRKLRERESAVITAYSTREHAAAVVYTQTKS